MSGGYSARKRYISPSLKAKVFERDRGLCRRCGRPGNDIDHIAGDSGSMENLQLLCRSCHNDKTKELMIEITPEDQDFPAFVKKRKMLLFRCSCPLPLRLCDDEEQWPKQYVGVMATWRKTLNHV
jgi:hypothetical protein